MAPAKAENSVAGESSVLKILDKKPLLFQIRGLFIVGVFPLDEKRKAIEIFMGRRIFILGGKWRMNCVF